MIPFDITLDDDGNIDAPFSIEGVDFNIGSGGGGSPGLNPGPTTEGAPIGGNGDEGGRDVPEAPAGSRCIAVAVTVSGFGQGDGMVVNSAPNVRRYEIFGNAAVEVATDTGNRYWQDNVDLRSDRTLVPIAVEGLRVLGFRVNLRPGLTYSAIPIYRADTQET